MNKSLCNRNDLKAFLWLVLFYIVVGAVQLKAVNAFSSNGRKYWSRNPLIRKTTSTSISSLQTVFSSSSHENESENRNDIEEMKGTILETDSFATLVNSASVLFSSATDTNKDNIVSTEVHDMEASQGWDVYVCQSKPCKERGSGATLDAFVALAPHKSIAVHPAVLMKAKGKKGPNVRCVPRENHSFTTYRNDRRAFEVNNVDSVDKVYMILTKYMGITGVESSARECLKWNYRGNALFEKGDISGAIDAYNKAIDTGYSEQEGLILLMRASAYLKRASDHQKALRQVVSDLAQSVPDPSGMGCMYSTAMEHPSLANSIFQRVMEDCKSQDKKFRQTKYRHGLYEYALLHATQDSLRATQLLPKYAKAWLRAGDSLAELRKFKESAQYYQKALELDPSLSEALTPLIERLEKSQQFFDEARIDGWSEDTLRLALDVTG